MKQYLKKALCLVCAGALALGATACSGSRKSGGGRSNVVTGTSSAVLGKAADYDYENFTYSDSIDENGYWEGVTALDYVTLPSDYASVSVSRADVEPSDQDVEDNISDLLYGYATINEITDRAAKDGDTVNIDYAGTVDGVAFTGGTYAGYNLTLGSGNFIDDFEDQIVGHTPGETFDVNVTFPEGYNDSTDSAGNTVALSGADAVFSVTLNYISEEIVPELTDDWVAENVSEENINTVDELREFYRNQIYTENLRTAVMDYLVEKSTFSAIPQKVMDYQVNQCLNYYYTMGSYYGYELDEFVSVFGYESADDMLAEMEDDIVKYSKEALLYQAVSEAMGVTPTQEQIDTYAGYTTYYGENYCRMVALMDAVSEALCSGAQVA